VGRSGGEWLLALLALVVAIAASGRASGIDRATGLGLATVLAAVGAGGDSAALEVARLVGEAAVAVAACIAVSRIVPAPGLWRADPPPAFPAVVAALGLAVVAAAASVSPEHGAARWLGALAPAATWTAMLGTVAAIVATIEWTARARWLELEVVERVAAMRALLWTLCVAGTMVAVLGHVDATRVASLVVTTAGFAVVAGAETRDATAVARAARRIVVLTIAGGAVGLLGAATAAGGLRGDAWIATVVTAAVAIALGAAVAQIEGPTRPAGGAWLDAFARASDKAASAEPHDAIRETLVAVRDAGAAGGPSPELWTFSPTTVTTVDAAGYVHEQPGEVPDALVAVASGESAGTLRVEVLAALEVRRPEVRPLFNWMRARGGVLATVVGCGGETEGVLLVPRGGRTTPVTLEEIQALRVVADRIAVACRARGAQSRMLARANDAVERAARAEARAEALLRERALDLTRNALAAARLARPATVGIYSAASRLALEALERRTTSGSPVAIVVPSGGDPVPYLARGHLAGARARGPLVLVDGTSAREHELGRWSDPSSSPLALAEGGMLVLLDGAALPSEVQQLVARACAERRAPWDEETPIDVVLALTGIAPPEELVSEGRLDAALAARLGDAREAPIALPRLRDRVEDVRAILTDSLARQGLRVLGRPVGIDNAAYARLIEHEFPGEDAELTAMVERLVARCAADRGRDVVRAADLDAGLGAPAPASRSAPRSARSV
jgi:hypothetical protein